MSVQDLVGSAPHVVTPLISVEPAHFESHMVSPDGKFAFARNLSGKGQLYPFAGAEPQSLPGWLPKDIWITWSADGRSAYVCHDEKTSAPVYRLDVATGKRELVMTLGPNDSAGVTAIQNLRITPDGKSYAIPSVESCQTFSLWTTRAEPIISRTIPILNNRLDRKPIPLAQHL
jgi:Tol biopolymer transport system component